MIIIYAHKKTNRLQYTLDVLFNILLQSDYKLVSKNDFIKETHKPKINYSSDYLQADIQIVPHSLLFENNINTQHIAVTYKGSIPFFFKTKDSGNFQFDIFASSFYMLSRYEEYLEFTSDFHSRFTAKNSLAYKTGFLQLPIVHLWSNSIKDFLQEKHPELNFKKRKYNHINTIDVDIAYAYKGKPLIRGLGATIKSILQLNYKDIKQRILFLTKGEDPYDTYNLIKKTSEKYKAKTYCFFQVGAYGKYDKNLPINANMLQLITSCVDWSTVGIHPSYNSNYDTELLQHEINALSSVLNRTVIYSRQHYLKLTFPKTYENLIKTGIKYDFTMGFADFTGFRAGMSLPFPFFNLKINEQRPLTIVPFQIMDGTLKDYMQLTPEEAIKEIEKIKKQTKAVGGQLVSIFHNSFFADTNNDWKRVFYSLFH